MKILKRFGPRGDAVRQLQRDLNTLYAGRATPLEVDGIFGPNTESAVRRFQVESGLKNDGAYGPNTHAALMAALEKIKQKKGAPPFRPQEIDMEPMDIKGSQKKKVEKAIEKYKNSDNYKKLEKKYGKQKVDKALFLFGRALDVGKVLAGLGALEAVGLTGLALGFQGVGLVFTPGIFLYAWLKAWDGSKAGYALRAHSYTSTAWAFNKEKLYESKEMKSRILGFGLRDEADLREYDDAWKDIMDKTISEIRDTEYGKTFAGDRVTHEDVKTAIQLIHETPQAFCLALNRQMGPAVRDRLGEKHYESWKLNEHVVYPQ